MRECCSTCLDRECRAESLALVDDNPSAFVSSQVCGDLDFSIFCECIYRLLLTVLSGRFSCSSYFMLLYDGCFML